MLDVYAISVFYPNCMIFSSLHRFNKQMIINITIFISQTNNNNNYKQLNFILL